MSASLAADRVDLVDALTTTIPINGTDQALDPSPSIPAPIVAYSAWPIADGSQWVNGCAADSAWRVMIALPAGDSLAAAQAFDAVHDVIAPRLAKLGRVSNVVPAVWVVSQAEQIPVVQINVNM